MLSSINHASVFIAEVKQWIKINQNIQDAAVLHNQQHLCLAVKKITIFISSSNT